MKRSLLRKACENAYGYLDATPGTDLARRLNASETTIKKYIRAGWIRKVGTGLVLTQDGYRAL